MPQSIRTFNDPGQDREIDLLWSKIRALESQLKALQAPQNASSTPGAAQILPDSTSGLITVQTEAGDPVLSVSGLEFVSTDGFSITEDQGLAKIDLTGIGATSITASSPLVATPSPITGSGVLSHGNSGVTPGSYSSADITVDARGHITAASNGTGSGSGVSVEVSGGTAVGPELNLNFIPGTNISSIVATDDAPNSRVNVTINAASGGSSRPVWPAVDVVGSGSGLPIDTTITVPNVLYQFHTTLGASPQRCTLPPNTSAVNGDIFGLVNLGSGSLLVRVDNGGGVYTTLLTLAAGDSCLVYCDGSVYQILCLTLAAASLSTRGLGTPNQQTASYAPVLTDANGIIEITVSGGAGLTIPNNSTVAFPLGTTIDIVQMGTGAISVGGTTGVTLHSRGSLFNTNGQYARVQIYKSATNTWILSGDRA